MARLRKTLTDYIVIGISPALIIALVSSLMLFVLEVFYRGGFALRMSAIVFLFVLATTLIARISIDEGREYAAWFAAPLAIVMWLAVLRFTSFGSVIGMALIAAIWWCTDKLTWDCTVIDEQQDASGEGLLQTVGMEGDSASPSAAGPDPLEATSSRQPAEAKTWWDRYLEYRRRAHAPGVWVVYFSLAALPLFGIGQRFIPSGDVDSRRYVFKLLCVYVVSALGLLLTTSFLGLRRYLRQRRIEMPVEMAGTWLAVGAVMIFALLAFCTLLPRPHAEYSITQLTFGSPDNIKPSRWGVPPEGVKDDENRAAMSADGEDDTSNARPGGKKNGGSEPGAESGESGGSGEGDGKQGGGSKQGKQGDSSSQGKQGGQQGKSSDGKQNGGEQDHGNDPQNEDSQRSGSTGDQDRSDNKKQGGKQSSQSGQPRTGSSPQDQSPSGDSSSSSDNSQASSPSSSGPSSLSNMLQQLPNFGLHALKWLYYLAFFLLVGFFVWRYREQVAEALQNFINALREFWAKLFGGRDAMESPAEEAVAARPVHKPFAAYQNPFIGGQTRLPPRELVRYTFEALEAWARERQCPRQAEQTPHEFAFQLNQADPEIARDARSLADLYCRAAYSQRQLTSQQLDPLASLWQAMSASLRPPVQTPAG